MTVACLAESQNRANFRSSRVLLEEERVKVSIKPRTLQRKQSAVLHFQDRMGLCSAHAIAAPLTIRSSRRLEPLRWRSATVSTGCCSTHYRRRLFETSLLA